MKKVVVKGNSEGDKPFTYNTNYVDVKGDVVEFIDKYNVKRIIPLHRLLEIQEVNQ